MKKNKGVTEIKGDLFETHCDVIAHGVNCRNGFGSGIAGQIAKLYPEVKEAYHRKFKEEGWKLGETQYVKTENDLWVVNCSTQDKYGYDNELLVDYDAVRKCMTQVQMGLSPFCLTLAIPRIGCGLAGGDWKIVKQILEEVFTEMEVLVYVK